jgi:hypothetical protein
MTNSDDDDDLLTSVTSEILSAIQSNPIQFNQIRSDPSLSDWYDSTSQYFLDNESSPLDTFNDVQSVIRSNTSLSTNFRGIVFNDDAPDNESALYQLIFCPVDPLTEPDSPEFEPNFPIFLEESPSLSEDPALEFQNTAIAQLSSIFAISRGVSILVLRQFNWDRDRASAAFCESRSSILSKLHIPESCVLENRPLFPTSEPFSCGVCFCDFNSGFSPFPAAIRSAKPAGVVTRNFNFPHVLVIFSVLTGAESLSCRPTFSSFVAPRPLLHLNAFC